MATRPISNNVAKTIIPDRQAMSDTHRELYFARWDARNRLVTGGAAMFPGEGGTNLRRPVAERLKRLWPQIGDVEFDYVWSGYVGMTPDNLLHPEVPGFPRVHRLGPNGFAWARPIRARPLRLPPRAVRRGGSTWNRGESGGHFNR